MIKLLITYRATIDRHVPIAVRSRLSKQQSSKKSRFIIVRERVRSFV